MKTKEQIEWLKSGVGRGDQYFLSILENLARQEEAMTKEEILQWAERIRPVLRGSSKLALSPKNLQSQELWWSDPCPISTGSFTFQGKGSKRAFGLKEIGRITTYHRYGGYYGILRPSTDEAIIQCPKRWLSKAVAFEFQTLHLNFNEVYNGILDRHVLTTVYYEGELPEDVAAYPVTW